MVQNKRIVCSNVDDASINIMEMMASWTKVQGYPVVLIEETTNSASENGANVDLGPYGDRRTFKLTQKLFGDVDSTMVKENTTLWQIPIQVLNGGFETNYETYTPISVFYMKNETMEISIPYSAHEKFIRFMLVNWRLSVLNSKISPHLTSFATQFGEWRRYV